MSTEPMMTEAEYAELYPLPGHVPAFSPEDKATYAEIFPDQAHTAGQESEPPDPEPITEPPAAPAVTTRQDSLELAVFRAAGAAADPAVLLDNVTFLASIKDIDPDDSEAITAAITAAVESNPRLGAAPSRLPLPNPAQGSSGSGPVIDADDLLYSKYFPTTERL